jgi:hypothetical protein
VYPPGGAPTGAPAGTHNGDPLQNRRNLPYFTREVARSGQGGDEAYREMVLLIRSGASGDLLTVLLNQLACHHHAMHFRCTIVDAEGSRRLVPLAQRYIS